VSLLVVDNLHTHFISRDLDNRLRTAKALNSVSFSLDEGEVLGLVGETGAGKSLTAFSIMGLLRPPARIVGGSIRFGGEELIGLDPEQLNAVRGSRIAMVGQNARGALDPLTRVGEQIVRVILAHQKIGEAEARATALEAMARVGIPDPGRRFRSWPHELSGGMAQRVLIAMALANRPKLLIADEPTTGLDVTVQAQILDLLRDLVRDLNMAALIITHDLGVVAHYCRRMAVMFAGRIVETGPVEAVFEAPQHPYTKALIAATPENLELDSGATLGGRPPNLYALPPGCHYVDRCPVAIDVCHTTPPWRSTAAGRGALCHRVGT
jgi:peptide/nickel transport system ATP-binding protein/oligopeptide transport system ATP-binding protein